MYEDVKDKKYCLAYDNSYNDVGEIKYNYNYKHIPNIRELKKDVKTDKNLYEIVYKKVIIF